MLYYIYFDGYGHIRQIINEKDLAAKYGNDPEKFLRALSYSQTRDAGANHSTGHVGKLRFDDENELNDYLESLGDEITGFYGCRSESRPYNF
jgi:hypothetical protein